MRRLILLPLLALFAFAAVAPASSQSAVETKFNAKQAKELHKFSASAFKDGFPKIAKNVWLMLLSEYDSDHAKARAALGYERVGESWSLDPAFVYPRADNPDAKAAAKVRKKWESVSKKVADAHRKEARNYEKAGRTDMSKRHFEKVIFFLPFDKEAQDALKHQAVAGLTGTELEQTLYDRSKKIEAAVAEEARKDYPVEQLDASETHPFLEKAKVEYITVRSENFTLRGNFDAELLLEAAKNAERAIRVMAAVTEGYDDAPFSRDPNRWVRDWAYFKDKDTYTQILNANADLMTKDELEFRVEHSSASNLFANGVVIRVGSPQNEQGVYDGAVRNVAQAYSGLSTAALREGIGHTIVGHFFANNRAFIVDRKKQLESSTGEEDVDRFSPNMDTWGDLALEAAWKLSEGTPAAQLPLIDAAKFPDDARIKSWSFCDYVVRRDPTLLLDLDRLAEQKHILKVEKQFTEDHEGLSIAQLEKEWKDYWTEASPVLKAIRNNTPPLTSVSKDVKKWLTEFNKARTYHSTTEVTWSESYSGRCRAHVEYLLAHEDERGADREQGQNIELDGSSHFGDMFAQMSLVWTQGGKPKEIFEQWLHWPGYRDALINESLRTIGLYADKGIVVIDGIRGLGRAPEGEGGFKIFPNSPPEPVPISVPVAELGSELTALLERHGHGDKTEVGYPISIHHFGTGGLAGTLDSYACSVTIRGEKIEGMIHHADGGSNRRSSSPGMVVFYPFEPLKKGSTVEYVWTFETKSRNVRSEGEFDT